MLSLCLLFIYGIGVHADHYTDEYPIRYQCTEDVRPPGCQSTCLRRAQWGRCDDESMKGYCCNSCAEACDDQCTNAKWNCDCDTPPNAKYTCPVRKAWGSCDKESMVGYCCQSCPEACYDQCAPTATPTAAPTCDKSTRIRKAWNVLAQDERDLYITAFKKLADDGVIQQLSQTHWDSAAHGFFAFLPWHRAYVMLIEDVIRELGPEYECFAMPYWYVDYVINICCCSSIYKH